jgi:protein ImuA
MAFRSSPSGEGNHAKHGGGARAGFPKGAGRSCPENSPVPLHHLRWSPSPKGEEVRHAELFASSREASGAGLALAFALEQAEAEDQRPWLWVQDAAALRLGGRPYRPGLPRALRHRLLHVAAKSPEDALFALEEGLRCRDLAFVIGELAGNPRALSFTASRRLSLVAETHGVPLWLVRLDAARDLSSARQRWQVEAAPSLAPRWNKAAPGAPAWQAELFRARNHPPRQWILRDDGQARLVADWATAPPHHGSVAGAAGDRSLAAG